MSIKCLAHCFYYFDYDDYVLKIQREKDIVSAVEMLNIPVTRIMYQQTVFCEWKCTG